MMKQTNRIFPESEAYSMQELLTIHIIIEGCDTLKSPRGQINMIRFGGYCDCDCFKGEVLPGGVDTQMYLTGEPGRLSARYMLKGTDANGEPAMLFIENNGVFDADGVCTTTPVIHTDSETLRWLCETPLTGSISGWEKGVIIHFCKAE
ncbi:MAG: DUF3237 family protein [Clostridia bacterium]|nr:DUF3237 family protein [Clostridia bacterium]